MRSECELKIKEILNETQQKLQDLRKEMDAANSQSNTMMDVRLKYESELEKREKINSDLWDTIKRLEEGNKGKDEALLALSETLYEKGEENKRLAEMISEFKNQHLIT